MGRHRRRFTPADRQESIYRYLPIDLPPRTDALSIDLGYDDTRAVVDLGLFDPERFRGWSGGARRHVDVASSFATPGYLPGPLPAGRWRVILGLYLVPDEGVEVEVQWSLDQASPPPPPSLPPAPSRPPPRKLPAEEGRRWLACDLHSHTVHSDGALEVGELAILAAARGLEALAVTDHNTVSHHPHLGPAGDRAGIILIPGQEVTTASGHANCLGPTPWIDFRDSPGEWAAAARAGGGLLSINHPLAGPWAWGYPDPVEASLVEAWHWSWDRRSPEPLEWWRDRGGTPVGGSDFHRMSDPALPGSPTTWVEAEGDDVLGALGEGRVAISAHPRSPVVVRHPEALVVDGAEGCLLVGPDGARIPILSSRQTLPPVSGLHLVTDREGTVLALTP